MMMMTLDHLFKDITWTPHLPDQSPATLRPTGLCIDSRRVKPGDLFFALHGTKNNGNLYTLEAIEKGALAIVTDQDLDPTIPHIRVHNASLAVAYAAALFYQPKPTFIAAVTGTSGKSSVVHFAQQLWHHLGHPSASIGTLGCKHGTSLHHSTYGHLTTPDAITLHKELQDLAQKGITHVALEASSHGLKQHRLDGLSVNAVAFTNITEDHMDYHGDFDDYFKAKSRLFTDVAHGSCVAILNADCPHFETLRHLTSHLETITYGKNGDLRLINHERAHVTLAYKDQTYTFDLPLPGTFQIMNALCAAGMALASGAHMDDIIEGIKNLQPVPGRMQEVMPKANLKGPQVFVDYSHKPDALKKALLAIRPFCKGKLWVVFGCGGDRDTHKREVMGSIAAMHADHVIITDDNPRTENPDHIRAMILKGCPQAQNIGERRQAIAAAIDEAAPEDLILIAGKGHEEVQIYGDHLLRFSDLQVATDLLHERHAL